MSETSPAGWYPDPENSSQQRYWDGNAWTEHFAPVATAPAPAAVAKKPVYKRTWFVVVAVLFVLATIGNLLNDSSPSTPESTPAITQEAAPATAPEPEPAAAPSEPKPTAAAEPAEAEMTMGQQQAVQSAESYLGMGGFSRKKLIEQLVFEDFSKGDAEFAVVYLDPDWNAQAAQSAKSYVEMGGFSRGKLLEQLVFEGFSKSQAEYGVKAAGY